MAAEGITIKADVQDVMNALTYLSEEQAPYVLALALTRTGQEIQRVEQYTMGEVFDRPTPFTLNSLYLKPATKTDPTAIVQFKEGFGSVPAYRYLGPEVEGGDRSRKSHEKALTAAGILEADEYCVPGKGANLDAYGNMRGADITRILSQLKAGSDPTQYATASRRSKAKSSSVRFFVLRGKGVADGIYQATGGRAILQIIKFVKAPDYRARFPYYEVARDVFNSGFIANARAAWRQAVGRTFG